LVERYSAWKMLSLQIHKVDSLTGNDWTTRQLEQKLQVEKINIYEYQLTLYEKLYHTVIFLAFFDANTVVSHLTYTAFLHRMYKYHFVSECFDVDSIMDDMDRKFLRCCFPQPTVCILYSLQSKAIHMSSVLGTMLTFSSQYATILVTSLSLYVEFLI